MRSYLHTSIFTAFMAFISVIGYAMLQEKGMAAGAAAGLFLGVIVLILAWKQTEWTMILAVVALLCVPFFMGFSRSPKIFFNEILLLLVMAIVPMKILLRLEPLRIKPGEILCLLLGLVFTGLTMFYNPPTNLDLRGYIETLMMGVLLCLVFAQSSDEKLARNLTIVLAVVVILIAGYGIVETIRAKNPIMVRAEKVIEEGFIYMSSELLELTGEGSYRPYVTFFHPSEGATVMGLCLPFVIALWNAPKWRLLAATALILGVVFVVINATRGVWVGLLVAAFLFWPLFRRATIMLLPAVVLGGALVLLFFGESNYMERIMDLRNLRIRFFYWDLALTHLENHWLLGMGYSYFKDYYLLINPLVPTEIAADVSQVSTVDNSFLMILVEQGLIGLIGYFMIWGFLFQRLRHSQRVLTSENRTMEAGLARAGVISMTIFLTCSMLADVHLFWVATKLFFILTGLGWGLVAGREGDGLNVHGGR